MYYSIKYQFIYDNIFSGDRTIYCHTQNEIDKYLNILFNLPCKYIIVYYGKNQFKIYRKSDLIK